MCKHSHRHHTSGVEEAAVAEEVDEAGVEVGDVGEGVVRKPLCIKNSS